MSFIQKNCIVDELHVRTFSIVCDRVAFICRYTVKAHVECTNICDLYIDIAKGWQILALGNTIVS